APATPTATPTRADDATPPTDPRSYQVAIGAARLPLPEFLSACLRPAEAPPPAGAHDARELELLRELFLEAGVRALEQRATCAADWLQADVSPPAPGFSAELHAELGRLARRLLDDG